jgi:hypothetical protein
MLMAPSMPLEINAFPYSSPKSPSSGKSSPNVTKSALPLSSGARETTSPARELNLSNGNVQQMHITCTMNVHSSVQDPISKRSKKFGFRSLEFLQIVQEFFVCRLISYPCKIASRLLPSFPVADCGI